MIHAPHSTRTFATPEPFGQTLVRRRALCGALLPDDVAPGIVSCPRCLAALARKSGYANALRANGWSMGSEKA